MATKQKFNAEEGRSFFRRLAKDGPWAPIYLLMGSERYLVQEAIDRLIRAYFPEGPDDFNFSAFDAREVPATEVISACEMLPIFAEKRVVRLRNLDAWRAADLQVLAYYAESPSESTLLIMEASSFPKNSDASKRIHAAKSVVQTGFDGLNSKDTSAWVVRRGKTAYNLLIRNDLAAHIVDNVGDSLDALDRALEGLTVFVGAPKDGEGTIITQEHIDAVVVDARMRTVFELTDALVHRDLVRATKIYRRMRLHGDSSVGTVAMIAREFRGLLSAVEGQREGADERRVATLTGGPPWALKKHRENGRRFHPQELRSIVQAIAQTATELTSSRLKDDLHVERLILRICQPSAPQR